MRSCDTCISVDGTYLEEQRCRYHCEIAACGGWDEKWEWSLYEGMKCDEKRHIEERIAEQALQRAFLLSGKDVAIGCHFILNKFVSTAEEIETQVTSECTVPMHDENGAMNLAWSQDPCCNPEAARLQCCAPRQIEAVKKRVKELSPEQQASIAQYVAAMMQAGESSVEAQVAARQNAAAALSIFTGYAQEQRAAQMNCFPAFHRFMNSTGEAWESLELCRQEVYGTWSDSHMTDIGPVCTQDSDCYTNKCQVPQGDPMMMMPGYGMGGAQAETGSESGEAAQKHCATPRQVGGDSATPTVACLFAQGSREVGDVFKVKKVGLKGSATAADVAQKIQEIPGMVESHCEGRSHNSWQLNTKAECEAEKGCNWEWGRSGESCLDPCKAGGSGKSCKGFCGIEGSDWSMTWLPRCRREMDWNVWWPYEERELFYVPCRLRK
jgi:hypothetical protein